MRQDVPVEFGEAVPAGTRLTLQRLTAVARETDDSFTG
jgi:hypothetical protein